MPATASSDRNLLVGILALQLDFISRDQLVGAMHDWLLRKETPLEQILVEAGALSAEDRAALEHMLRRHLARHQGDVQRSLHALPATPQVWEQLTQITDDEVASSVRGLLPPLPVRGARPSSPGATTTGRFRRVGEHARGGLGVVLLAVDEELHRDVALKEIRPEKADHPAFRARFLMEGEVTAKLEHPGVVPVYGMGVYPDGRPYYAMRFVRGESLHDAVTRFHAEDQPGRDSSERSLALRDLLTRFVAVCNTVAHAHSKGVIHRDLKPANVMLGPFGETLVVDWGVARLLREPEGLATQATGWLRLSGEASTDATGAGQAVGTPAFMAPEQARGEQEQVGVASDVFALGATLYNLLTGRAPFEHLAEVREGRFPAPCQVKKSVPPALEAVCLKAMAVRPNERYAAATALKEDVERWLADEPVSAYREPWTERTRRWARRHRAVVGTALAVLITALVASTVGLWAYHREQRRTAEQRDRAEENLARAKQAVDECFLIAKDHPLLQQENMKKVKRLLLEKALPFYENFRRQQGGAALEREQADTWWRLGVIAAEFGRLNQALTCYEEARDIQQRLLDADPDDPECASDLASTCSSLAVVQSDAGQARQARASIEQVLRIGERLVKEHPGVPAYQKILGTAYHGLGTQHNLAGQSREALAWYEQARRVWEGLAAAHPDETDYQRRLALTCNNIANQEVHLGRRQAALERYQEVRRIMERLARAEPEVNEFQSALALACYNLGHQQHTVGRRKEALASLEQARRLYEPLTIAHADVPEFQSMLALVCAETATMQREAGQREEARAQYEQARRLGERLVKDHPEVVDYQRRLATTYHRLSQLHQEAGRWQEALASVEREREIRERLAAAHPEVPSDQSALADAHEQRAALLRATGRRKEALASYEQTRPIRERQARAHPDEPGYQVTLAATYHNLGVLQKALKQRKQALANYQRGQQLLERLTRTHPEVPRYHRDLAILTDNLSLFQKEEGQRKQALASNERARQEWQLLVKALPDVTQYQVWLARNVRRRAQLLGDSGAAATTIVADYERAIQRLEAVRRRDPANRSAREALWTCCYELALVFERQGLHREAAAAWGKALAHDPGPNRGVFATRRVAALARAGDHAAARREAATLAGGKNSPPGRLYDLACGLALAARAVRQDRTLPLPLAEKQARRDGDEALRLLKQARRAGHFARAEVVKALQEDPDLAVLRERADYREFVASLRPISP